MAIRMRRGNEADFDPSKMLPGEWAVSTDTKYVRMCFSPGIVLRMATYEAFESDMAEIRNILSECQSIQTAVELIQQNVTNSELVIENYVKEAKQYRDEAEQFRNEASMFAPEGYEDLVKNVSDNTVKIDTIIEKAELNIKNNAKGSNIHLTDSADSNVVALELYGKTEQNAYTGKNLFKMREENISNSGITVTFDKENQSFSVEGTASANVSISLTDNFEVLNEKFSKGGTFFMSMVNATYNNPNFNVNVAYRLEGEENSRYVVPDGKADTIPSGTVVRHISLYVQSGLTVKASNVKIQLEENSVATEWEPYVGGMPSPSPSYPQEIKSVKGKNLLDCRGLTEQTTNGVTFTPVYDENDNLLYINVNGTASEVSYYYLMPTIIYKAGKYIFSGCPSGGSNSSYLIYDDVSYKGEYGDGKELNLSDDTKIRLRIYIYKGIVCNNLKFYPMIRQASIKDDTYVPYGLLRIKTHGKNLIKGSQTFEDFDRARMSLWTKETETYNGLTVLSKNTAWDGVFKKNFYVENGKTYTFSAFVKTSENHSGSLYLLYENYTTAGSSINSKAIDCTTEWKRFSITFTCTKSGLICPRVESITDGVRIYVCGYQVEESPIMTEYQPYKSTEITLSEPIELNGFNGVYDVVTSDGVTRRFAKVRVLSSFDWTVSGGDAGADGHCFQTRTYSELFAKNTNEYVLTNALCTHFIIKKSSDLYFKSSDEIGDGIAIWQNTNGYNVIRCRNTDCSSLADFKTWLNENEVYLLYELSTPTTEALQSDFTALKTFYPETYVSNDADCDMSITYTADAKNYIDNKIALLTTALYNNI